MALAFLPIATEAFASAFEAPRRLSNLRIACESFISSLLILPAILPAVDAPRATAQPVNAAIEAPKLHQLVARAVAAAITISTTTSAIRSRMMPRTDATRTPEDRMPVATEFAAPSIALICSATCAAAAR